MTVPSPLWFEDIQLWGLLLLLFTSCNKSICHECINLDGKTLSERVVPPNGYKRQAYSQSSWKGFLQNLEVLQHGAKIVDFRGDPISEQSSHIAIVNFDVGNKDLQQCADAVIRLRSEFLFAQKRFNDIQFKFTSGHNYKWVDHAHGIRPVVKGNKVSFKQKSEPDNSYQNFRVYLDIVFMYAGTISLNRDLLKIDRNEKPEVGDVIIKPGSPGHAVIVVDRAKTITGNYIYLLAEGYTPAQSIHVLSSNENKISPWFRISESGPIYSDRYFFKNPNLRRFEN